LFNLALLRTALAFIICDHAFRGGDGVGETLNGAPWEVTNLFWNALGDGASYEGDQEEEEF